MIFSRVSYRQVLDSPEWQALAEEYASECASPELGPFDPDRDIYRKLEESGGMACFALYLGGEMIGFVSLLMYGLPHFGGKKIAATESIFIAGKHRSGNAGLGMLDFVEEFARREGCMAILYTAPVGSRFSDFLAFHPDYRHSNNTFVRQLC